MAQGTGIYIINDTLRWVAAEVKDGIPAIIRAGSGKISEDGSFELPDDIPEDIAVCFSPDHSYFYKLNFPFRSFNKIRSVLKNDIEEKSIDPIDSVIADFYAVESSKEGTRGFGVTLPREQVEVGIEVTGNKKEACLITLDIFAVSELIRRSGFRKESYFLAVFTSKTVLIGEVKECAFRNFRSIPTKIETRKDAEKAVHELLKRFEVPDPKEDVVVISASAEISEMLRGSDDFPCSLVDISLERKDGSDIETADLLVPAAAAAAALCPEQFPNFRQEDLKYSGSFYGLMNHGILFLSILAVFFLVTAGYVMLKTAGYEQEVKSLNAILQEEAEISIGKEELDKLSGNLLEDKIRKVYKETVDKNPDINDSGLPESAFKILHSILGFVPEGLDITWQRIIIREQIISLSGKLNAEDSGKYDTFIDNLKKSDTFNVQLNHVRANTFRITLRVKEQ